MFNVLLIAGSLLFAVLGWLVFELSIVNMFFFIIIMIFYFCSGYYFGLNGKEINYLTKTEVDNILNEDNQ